MTSLLPRPHHWATSFGSVMARHTRSRDALKIRSGRVSRSDGVVTTAAALLVGLLAWVVIGVSICVLIDGLLSGSRRLLLRAFEERLESIESVLQHAAVHRDPLRFLLESLRTEAAVAHTPDL